MNNINNNNKNDCFLISKNPFFSFSPSSAAIYTFIFNKVFNLNTTKSLLRFVYKRFFFFSLLFG